MDLSLSPRGCAGAWVLKPACARRRICLFNALVAGCGEVGIGRASLLPQRLKPYSTQRSYRSAKSAAPPKIESATPPKIESVRHPQSSATRLFPKSSATRFFPQPVLGPLANSAERAVQHRSSVIRDGRGGPADSTKHYSIRRILSCLQDFTAGRASICHNNSFVRWRTCVPVSTSTRTVRDRKIPIRLTLR